MCRGVKTLGDKQVQPRFIGAVMRADRGALPAPGPGVGLGRVAYSRCERALGAQSVRIRLSSPTAVQTNTRTQDGSRRADRGFPLPIDGHAGTSREYVRQGGPLRTDHMPPYSSQ